MRILVVEDEPALRDGLVELLSEAGYTAEAVEDGEAALERGADPAVELLLLDLMLPRMDGLEVCRRLRQSRPSLPILVLTARGTEDDKVDGLRSGADDYLTKPFSARELLARIEALARRSGAAGDPAQIIEIDGCHIDLGRCEARRGETRTPLTAREARILGWLFQNRARAVSRSELLSEVWGAPGDLQTRTVDMTIANLRQKIEQNPAIPNIVVTVKGIGYAWGRS